MSSPKRSPKSLTLRAVAHFPTSTRVGNEVTNIDQGMRQA
jgi:hypothetical protein